MSAVPTLPLPAPISDPEVCAVCHSPVRPTARYCLRCGTRRGDAREELVELLLVEDAPAPTPIPAPRANVAPASLPTPEGPATWPLALTAIVLLALVIGLLTGRWLADQREAPAPAATTTPQVVHVAPTTATP